MAQEGITEKALAGLCDCCLGLAMEIFLLSQLFKYPLSNIFVLEQAVGPGALQIFSTYAVKQ